MATNEILLNVCLIICTWDRLTRKDFATQEPLLKGFESSADTIGTLSTDDDDGKKMNLRSFKLNRVYLDPLNMSNAGDFSWSSILKDFIQAQKDEGKFVVVCPRPP